MSILKNSSMHIVEKRRQFREHTMNKGQRRTCEWLKQALWNKLSLLSRGTGPISFWKYVLLLRTKENVNISTCFPTQQVLEHKIPCMWVGKDEDQAYIICCSFLKNRGLYAAQDGLKLVIFLSPPPPTPPGCCWHYRCVPPHMAHSLLFLTCQILIAVIHLKKAYNWNQEDVQVWKAVLTKDFNDYNVGVIFLDNS